MRSVKRVRAVAGLCALASVVTLHAQTDSLPAWNDGPAKTAISDFVAKVTKQGSPDFVPPAERIATLDNDDEGGAH